MLELKEWAELRENSGLESAKDELNRESSKLKIWKSRKLEVDNWRLRELRICEQYSLRYCEEKEAYLRNLEAKKAYYNLLIKS
ncbi:MAG: hypothetical protein ACFFDB_06850 [Promethearchaeota archaeon]